VAIIDFHKRELPVGPPVDHKLSREDCWSRSARRDCRWQPSLIASVPILLGLEPQGIPCPIRLFQVFAVIMPIDDCLSLKMVPVNLRLEELAAPS